jgi:hypothetical protein
MKKSFVLLTVFLLLAPLYHSRAQEIDLLMESNGYVPPFYEGRPLWSNQSFVTITAIPQIPGVSNPASLNYKWTKNNVVLGTVSGVGKNSLRFSDSVLGKPQTVKIEILSSDGAILASRMFQLAPIPQELLVYENNPLLGFLFNKEVGGRYDIMSQEVTFAAFPLFFSTSNPLNSLIQYTWNTSTGDTEKNNSVTYRVPEGASGSSQVTLRAQHQSNIIQSGTKSFLVEFGDR